MCKRVQCIEQGERPMPAESALLERTFAVGRFTCTMTFPRPKPGAAVHLAAEWSPRVPQRLSSSELRAYRAGRDAALAEVARLLGGTVAVLEV